MPLALPKTKNRRVLEDFFAGDGCLMMHRWFIYLVYMAGELNAMQNLRRVIKRHFFDFAKRIRIPGLVGKRFGGWSSQWNVRAHLSSQEVSLDVCDSLKFWVLRHADWGFFRWRWVSHDAPPIHLPGIRGRWVKRHETNSQSRKKTVFRLCEVHPYPRVGS